MQPIKPKNFKQLLTHLLYNHDINVTVRTVYDRHPKETHIVPLKEVIDYFTKDMVYPFNDEPHFFTDINGTSIECNTNKDNQLRVMFIYDYNIIGEDLNTTIRGYKALLLKIEKHYNVDISFRLQKKNKHYPDSFIHLKIPLKYIKKEFDYDLEFKYDLERRFMFKQPNKQRFKTSRFSIRELKIKHVSIYPINN